MITFSMLARIFPAVDATSARRGSLADRPFSASVLDMPPEYHLNAKGARGKAHKFGCPRLVNHIHLAGSAIQLLVDSLAAASSFLASVSISLNITSGQATISVFV